jgi:hypothetical protein
MIIIETKSYVFSKEELISNKINKIFKDNETKMMAAVRQAMYENSHAVYNSYR